MKRNTKRNTTLCRTTLLMLGTLALGALGTPAQAQKFQITLNTASLAGTAGSLDFQFAPGGAAAPAGSVQISGFATTGTLAGTAVDTGGGTGTLPGLLSIANSGNFNDVFQGITFGSTLSFVATFSGPALSPPKGTTVGSTFAFSVLDPTGTATLLGTNADGSALDITVNADGSQTPQSGSAALTVTPLTVTPVPEASSALSLGLLLALGGSGLAVARRRRGPA